MPKAPSMPDAVPALPAHAPVVVVGGGAMGCSTLYHLAKSGVSDAILLERNQLTSGTTWHSAAQVRALRSTRNLTELIRYSAALYRELEEETGQSTGWIQEGSLSIAATPDRLTHIRRQADLARLYGVKATTISAGEAKNLWPLMNTQDVIGAVWSPDDGRVSPSDLCSALIKGAKAGGAKVFEQTGVTAILTRSGRIAGVETPRGVVACDTLVLCTGLWSREAGALAGCDIPLWPCEHFYLLTRAIPGIKGRMPTLSDHDAHLYIRDDSGGLLVGCFEPLGKAISPEKLGEDFAFQLLDEDWDHFEPMMENALHRLPALADAEVKTLLNGPESFTPDGSYYLGDVPETPGLYLGCGMNSVGVASAGGAGMALAEWITKGRPPFDLGELHPGRMPQGLFSAKALAARAPEVLGKHYEITYPGRQWLSARKLRGHPLQSRFETEGAQFGQVFGWERPIYFGDASSHALTFGKPAWFDCVGAEVDAAHNHAAIFDLSTFGKVDIAGADALRFLNRVCANDMDRVQGGVIYTQMLDDQGRIVSDLVAVRLDEQLFRLFLGTAALRRDMSWLLGQQDNEIIELTNRTEELATLALAGPESRKIMRSLGGGEAAELSYFRSCQTEIVGIPALVARLSYVGELGWEITVAAGRAAQLWDALRQQGARPAGLYAQTSMRIEKRHLSHGHDIDSDLTPIEAGLDFALGWKTPFKGREASLALKQRRNRIASLVLRNDDAMPIGGEPVLKDGQMIGKVTSAAFGYRVGKSVAIALLHADADNHPMERVEVRIAGEDWPARLVGGAAFDPNGECLR